VRYPGAAARERHAWYPCARVRGELRVHRHAAPGLRGVDRGRLRYDWYRRRQVPAAVRHDPRVPVSPVPSQERPHVDRAPAAQLAVQYDPRAGLRPWCRPLPALRWPAPAQVTCVLFQPARRPSKPVSLQARAALSRVSDAWRLRLWMWNRAANHCGV